MEVDRLGLGRDETGSPLTPSVLGLLFSAPSDLVEVPGTGASQELVGDRVMAGRAGGTMPYLSTT